MLIKIIPPNTKYGRLTITGNYELRKASKNNIAYFECICDCGNIIWARGSNIRYGSTRSCGCRVGQKYKHNSSKTRLYRIWNNMRSRCNAPKIASYKNYGARGISVCEEWSGKDGVVNFCEWSMNNGYEEGLQIDRIDNDGIYCPQNCRWVTPHENSLNRRVSLKAEYKGQVKTLMEFAEEFNIPYKTLFCRIKYLGWDIEKSLKQPIRK